jgi:anti-sigma B factor antagonist
MAAAPGTVGVYQEGQTLHVRVEGRGIMAHGLPLRRVGEGALARGANAVRVDLRHCVYLDSTFLGTLLALQNQLARRGEGRLVLISPSPPCAGLLQQMGLHEIFAIESADEPSFPWREVPAGSPDAPAFKQNVAQAHEHLANLPGRAGETFRAVVRCIQQAEAEKAPPPPRRNGG